MQCPSLYLFILVVCKTVLTIEFHETLNNEDLKHYFGTDAKENVPEYEIIEPIYINPQRSRRSAYSPAPPLEYQLSALGENYHLQLQHNHHLIAPGCLVTTFEDGEITKPCTMQQTDCYYHGVSTTHVNSSVAVSTCYGLHGMISTPNHEIIIQPIKDQHQTEATSEFKIPHVVYKVVTRKKRSCGLKAENDDVLGKLGHRFRRQTGKKYMEMLLVADKSMSNYHGDDVTHYMLTTANVAAARFLDPSLEIQLHLSIVRVKILKNIQPGLNIVPDASSTLRSFCEWQEKFNPISDNDPLHADVASLMTKTDLVYLGEASTTGLATLEGMCGKSTRCSVLEDDGMDVGLTMAHETGHNLGIHHDGETNTCSDFKNIMSTGGGGGPEVFKWSKCSAQYLHKFLGLAKSHCLNDVPQGNAVGLPKQLPGVLYSGDTQCEFFVGKGSTLCTGTSLVDKFGGDECAKLVCFDPSHIGMCTASQIPRMDGTECGSRKWCIGAKCVDIGPNGPKPQDGGWSEFTSSWSECSRSCGGGVKHKLRTCDNPRPLFGGRDCSGETIKAELCNIKDCPTSQHTFKMEQCASTDSESFNGKRFHWVPQSTSGENQCALYCRPSTRGIVSIRTIKGKQNYLDGTECLVEGSDYSKCLNGECRAFGCDGVSDSGRRNDKCGVCGGRGNTCKKIHGKFKQGKEHEYVTFLKLPRGASGVTITNQNRYSTLSLSVSGQRVINKASGLKERSGTFSSGKMNLKYRPYPEKIEVNGVLDEDADVQVYRTYGDAYGTQAQPDITYEYFLSSDEGEGHKFNWKTVEGKCSVTCGQGSLQTEAKCEESGNEVAAYKCNLADKPSSVGHPCSRPDCPTSWITGEYSSCSKSCGGGIQSRSVSCISGSKSVPETKCLGDKPTNQQTCGRGTCPGVWKVTGWSACSQTCSRGTKSRMVKCYLGTSLVTDSKCLPSNKPTTEDSCQDQACSSTSSTSVCEDKKECQGRTDDICNGQYKSWAATNCQKLCGYCGTKDPITNTGTCTDKDAATCVGYVAKMGESFCTGDYAAWAKINCAATCHVCRSKQVTGEVIQESCFDKDVSTCQAYLKQNGIAFCSGDYMAWATDNCAASCKFCKTQSDTVQNTVRKTDNGSCKDTLDTCSQYELKTCTDYADWAKDNCAKTCNLCPASSSTQTSSPSVPTQTGESCQDTATNCKDYAQSYCQQYEEWAHSSCKKHCGFCPGAGGAVCENEAQCDAYDQTMCADYSEWARKNCAKKCNYCGETASSCVDKSSDCAGYGKSACTQYESWAHTNCQKYCGFCTS